MTPKWQALIVDGQFSQKLRDRIVHASGAYAIREKKGHKVVYVGESRRGVMWKTLLRHFHAPESFRKTRQRGIFTTRSPASYEVAVWVTGKGHRPRGKAEPDQKAMAAQAEWIKRLRPSHNDDDGMAYDDDFSLPDEPDDPWYGLGVSNPGNRWDNAKTAEKYAALRFSEPPVQKHQRLEKVALVDIEPERTWSENKLAALRSKYAKGDLLEPVRLMRGETGKWAIVDGNHRVALVRELGESHVLAVVDREMNPGGRKGCVELGKLTRITWKGAKRGGRAWSLEQAPSLVYTPQGRLLIVYDAQPTKTKASLAALASYVRKHWGSLPSSTRLSEGDVAKAPFVALGEGVDITYTTRKDGRKLVDYVHRWGDTVDGTADEREPGFSAPVVEEHACGNAGCASEGRLALRGGTYRVTDHGIVG